VSEFQLRDRVLRRHYRRRLSRKLRRRVFAFLGAVALLHLVAAAAVVIVAVS
jgi:hypothetical protein